MISTTYTAPAQTRAELALPGDTELPPDFDRLKYPILARHVFGLVPKRPALRLVRDRSLLPTDDDDVIDIERIAWLAYTAAVDANDKHHSIATKQCFDAAFNTWQRVYLLDQHGEVRP